MRILIFDTETTGLCTEKNPLITEFEKWPHIIQLSFILFDTDSDKIIVSFDEVICLADDVPISDVSISLHGITRAISKNKGIPIKQAIEIFNICLEKTDQIVAHNLVFDKRMIMVESTRHGLSLDLWNNVSEYCTMKKSTNLCKIVRYFKNGGMYYKYPTQSELFNHLFNYTPQGVHNSFIDILVCLKCYYQMIYHKDICDNNKKIKAMFNKYKI